jgi:hypothetical protein
MPFGFGESAEVDTFCEETRMKQSISLLLATLLSSAGLANAATPESACANLAERMKKMKTAMGCH